LLPVSLSSWLLAMAPAQSSTIRNPQPDGPVSGGTASAQGDAASVHPVLQEASMNRVEHPPGPAGPSSPAGSPVPEPRTLLLVGTGLLGLGVLTQTNRRRRHPASSGSN
jgi:hypothetical protein